jgi:hypothetical protein
LAESPRKSAASAASAEDPDHTLATSSTANIARLANRAIHSTRRYDTSVDGVGAGQQSWLMASFETL